MDFTMNKIRKEKIRIFLSKASKGLYHKKIKHTKLIVGDALAILLPMIFVIFTYLTYYMGSDIRATPFTTNMLNPFGFITPFLWMVLIMRLFSPYFHSLFGRDVPTKKNGSIILTLFLIVIFSNLIHHKYNEYSYFTITATTKVLMILGERQEIIIKKLYEAEKKLMKLDSNYKPESEGDGDYVSFVKNSDIDRKYDDIIKKYDKKFEKEHPDLNLP